MLEPFSDQMENMVEYLKLSHDLSLVLVSWFVVTGGLMIK